MAQEAVMTAGSPPGSGLMRLSPPPPRLSAHLSWSWTHTDAPAVANQGQADGNKDGAVGAGLGAQWQHT